MTKVEDVQTLPESFGMALPGTVPASKADTVERFYAIPNYMPDLRIIRDHKDLRLRKQLFPAAEALVFDTTKKGFVPLPILLRKAMRHLSSPELRALIYLALRASRFGICYPTQEEIAYEVGLEGTKNLQPVLKSLERMRFISTRMSMGKKFYLVHDPMVGLQKLLDEGQIGDDELTDINNLCEDLGRPYLQRSTSAPLSVAQLNEQREQTTTSRGL